MGFCIVRIGCLVWTFNYSAPTRIQWDSLLTVDFFKPIQYTIFIELLPKTIADTLYDMNAEGFAWIAAVLEEHCIIPLMQLCFGSLSNTPKEVVQDKKKEEVHAEKDGGSGSLLNSAKEVVDIQNDLDNASSNGGTSNVFIWC
jgi:hypothetical protein